jgi:hypothetical protein
LIAYDVRAEVLQPRTLKRRELISRLDDVELRPMAGNSAAALDTAELIAGLETPAAIWHVSDQFLSPQPAGNEKGGDSEMTENVSVHELSLALESVTNAGISAFRIRPVPLEYSRYEVYVQLALNSAAEAGTTSRLEVSVGGIPSQYREVDLEPSERRGISFQINGVTDQILHLRLVTEGDEFGADDMVTIPLPEVRPVLAAWIRPDDKEDPYTRFALSAVQESGSFELLKGSPDAWPLSEPVDAVVFDNWLPDEWPEDIPVIVINPPGSSGPVIAQALGNPIPYDSIRVGNEDHPVLFRVSSGRVAVTQTAVFESAGSLEPLWIAGNEPVLAAGEVKGQRLVVMGFSPGISERLPLTASFPLLMGNSLLWAVDRDMESSGIQLHSTGDLVRLNGKSITWREWKDNEWKTRRLPVESGYVEMDRLGAWESDRGERGASHLLSARESDLPGQRTEPNDAKEDYFAVTSGLGGKLKLWLIGTLAGILLLESWLFHRHAFY